jgi:Ca2+-binding RTX toxin-like protein
MTTLSSFVPSLLSPPSVHSANFVANSVADLVANSVADSAAAVSVTASAQVALVAIDARVDEVATLRSHLAPGVTTIVINADADGVAEVQQALEQNPTLRELHLISHGRPGLVEFGAIGISLETIEDRSQAQILGAIGDRLDRIAIYGCNVAAGDAGSELVEKLARLTGCAIAASTTKTGHRDRGGDWKLDVTGGDVDERPAIGIFQPSIETYPGLFAPPNDDFTGASGITEDAILNGNLITGGETGSVAGLLKTDNTIVSTGSGSATITTAKGATVTAQAGGTFTYSPASSTILQALPGGSSTTDTFNYLNLSSVPNTPTVTVAITGVNDLPIAQAISFNILEDNTTTPLGGVAVFDSAFSDVDTGDALKSITIASLPAAGTLKIGALNASVGSVVLRADIDELIFVPVPNSNVAQSFTFQVTDNLGSATSANVATATLNITPTSDPPGAVDDTAFTLPNTSVLIDVTANDSDPDGDPFDIFVSGSDTTSSKGGRISFTSTKTLTYTPPSGFVGVDTFLYAITDGSKKSSATVSVTVNTSPGANDDFAIATGGVASDIVPLANDTDANGSETVTFFSALPLATEKGGQITLADNTTQSYTYTAPSGFMGADRVTYTIKDQFGATDTAVININVADTVTDIVKTRINTHVLFKPLANDSQFEPLSFVSFETVGRNDGIISVEKDNTLRYTPPTNFEGEDYIFYTATDSLGNKDTALVTFVVSRLFEDPNIDPNIPVPNPEDLLTGSEGSTIVIPLLPPPVVNTTVSTRAVSSDAGGTAFGDVNNNAVVGLNGNDILVGFEGDDNLIGGSGNDQIFGNAGNDYIEGNSGDDLAFGGQGNDYIIGDAGDDLISGEDNEDIISGGDGNDFLFGNRGFDRIDGGRGNDSIFGGQNDDTLTGSFGDDVISGERGNDTIQGGNENDILFGNSENDLLDGSSGNDILYGGQNEDILYGGSGNDVLNGDVGNDALDGGAGDDTLTGGVGEDTLTGGDGVDRFTVVSDGSIDIITDFVPGTDKLFFPTLTRDLISVIDSGGNTLVQEFSTSTTLAVLTGITSSNIGVGDLAF